MLTREGFIAVDMSGQSLLRRSSWKAEAIRRGDLKISGPIPITEDMPLSEEEEKQFAQTGTFSPVDPHPDPQDDPVQRPPTPQNPPPPVPISNPPDVAEHSNALRSNPLESS